MLLSGKKVLITGANRGIGRAMVEVFAAHGACIFAHARKETPEFAAGIADVCERHHVEIRPVFFDVLDTPAMKSAVRQLAEIDVLVNNAGVLHGALFQMTSMKTIRDVFEVNFFSVLELTQSVIRLMQKKRSGSIVNMASLSGLELKAGSIAYGVSKAALIATTKTLAAELGASGIRVNAIAPGLTDTDMANLIEKEAQRKMIDNTSLKRLAQPKEIADVAAFLASDMASFVTGHVLCVDGGAI